jgi:membrane associated rhomboid family serine protease
MFRNIPPVIFNLLIINVLVFLMQLVLQSSLPAWEREIFYLYKSDLFGIRETQIVQGQEVYAEALAQPGGGARYIPTDRFNGIQLVTHFFSHGSFLHILINMFVLVNIGQNVERVVGSRRFLEFYLFSGFVGGLMTAFLDPSPVPVVGASGAIAGVAVAFAMIFPNERMIIIPIPIPIHAWKLILGFGVFSFIMVMLSYLDVFGSGGISHFGHLAGMIAALIYWFGRRYLNELRR